MGHSLAGAMCRCRFCSLTHWDGGAQDDRMDLRYSPAAEKFRREIRRWLASSVPAAWRRPRFWLDRDGTVESLDLRRAWEKDRADHGFAGVDWPEEFGGRGGDHELRAVHDEEMARARAPIGPFLGLTYL